MDEDNWTYTHSLNSRVSVYFINTSVLGASWFSIWHFIAAVND